MPKHYEKTLLSKLSGILKNAPQKSFGRTEKKKQARFCKA
jgi:hypothetical protein